MPMPTEADFALLTIGVTSLGGALVTIYSALRRHRAEADHFEVELVEKSAQKWLDSKDREIDKLRDELWRTRAALDSCRATASTTPTASPPASGPTG